MAKVLVLENETSVVVADEEMVTFLLGLPGCAVVMIVKAVEACLLGHAVEREWGAALVSAVLLGCKAIEESHAGLVAEMLAEVEVPKLVMVKALAVVDLACMADAESLVVAVLE